MTKIKVCGIFQLEDAVYVNEALPDYVGFVFAKTSKRYIDYKKAKTLRENISKNITVVGVFVDSPLELIVSLFNQQIIQIIQLHGMEDQFYVRRLIKKIPNAEIWQAFVITENADLEQAQRSEAHKILLDSGRGSGAKIKSDLLPTYLGPKYILAGGLTPENIPRAVQLKPWAVDLSSGVEINGIKSRDKILAAVHAARGK